MTESTLDWRWGPVTAVRLVRLSPPSSKRAVVAPKIQRVARLRFLALSQLRRGLDHRQFTPGKRKSVGAQEGGRDPSILRVRCKHGRHTTDPNAPCGRCKPLTSNSRLELTKLNCFSACTDVLCDPGPFTPPSAPLNYLENPEPSSLERKKPPLALADHWPDLSKHRWLSSG